MGKYAAALSIHPDSFEAAAQCAGDLLDQLEGERPDLVVVFAHSQHGAFFADTSAGLRKLLEADVVVGCTAPGVIGGPYEIEDKPAMSVFAANWGGGHARGFALDAFATSDGMRIDGWPDDLPADGTLLLMADPATFPVHDLLRLCAAHSPGLRVVGGLVTGAVAGAQSVLVLDELARTRGAVAVLLDPSVEVESLVSQGCRPIGRPLTITRATRNIVEELAGRPPLAWLRELATELDETERDLLRRGLHVGVVVDEHRAEFVRGDFVVRDLVSVDEHTGAIAIGEFVEAGQTLQFQIRDAASAHEDLAATVAGIQLEREVGVVLFTCAGRGRRLFGSAHHDATVIEDRIGRKPLAGMFCGGEIGPIAGRAFLHGSTASLAVFR